MIFESAAGTPVNQIARALHTYPNKVIYWRQRYVEQGLLGLQGPASLWPTVHGWGTVSHCPPEGVTQTAKRHGTLNLCAALEVSTGNIQGNVTQEKKQTEFQAFLDGIVGEYEPDQELHVVLDNDCTHKKNDEWLANHPTVHVHFTPTSASWLNQGEIGLGIFSRKALRGTSFASPQQLRQRIKDFIARYNPNSQPFQWRKRDVRGAQLKNNRFFVIRCGMNRFEVV